MVTRTGAGLHWGHLEFGKRGQLRCGLPAVVMHFGAGLPVFCINNMGGSILMAFIGFKTAPSWGGPGRFARHAYRNRIEQPRRKSRISAEHPGRNHIPLAIVQPSFRKLCAESDRAWGYGEMMQAPRGPFRQSSPFHPSLRSPSQPCPSDAAKNTKRRGIQAACFCGILLNLTRFIEHPWTSHSPDSHGP